MNQGRDVDAFAALDVGQTEIKARLSRPGADDLDVGLPGARTDLPLHPQLASAIVELGVRSGLRVTEVAIGTTGLTGVEADAGPLLDLVRSDGVNRVYLAHDSVTSYLGALQDTRGAVVAAGTGSIILALGRHDVARVDGWGHIMGDSGSGFWIGREGLRAAMRAHDGRGPQTAILPLIRERWPHVEDAYIDLQSDPGWVSTVASFSREIAALAAEDAEAARVCREAGRHLADSVATALRRVGEPSDPGTRAPVATLGKVFNSAVVSEAFTEALARSAPGTAVVEPAGSGVDGVALLPTLAGDHPLRRLVSVATR